MIPKLFAPSATSFTTNGIGSLPELISCEVTEERNGIYELEAQISIEARHYSDITHSAIIGAVPFDGGTVQGFRIYKITRPINGIVTIKARHISGQLSNIPVRPFSAANVGAALAGLKNNSMQTNPFTFWTDKSTAAAYNQTKPESVRARLGGQEGSVLDAFGGEYEWDNWTVRLWNNRGQDRAVTLMYGKNITDVRQEENIESTITGIVPFWAGGEDEVVYYNGIVEADTVQNFPYRRTVVHDFSSDFTEKPTAQQLKARAERYVIRNQIGIPHVSIKVSFVALWQTEEYKSVAPLQEVKLCDYVTIIFKKLGITAKAKVVRTVYDVLNERYSSIELGDARQDFASYVVGLAAQTAENADAISSNKNYVMTQIDQKLITFEGVMNEAIESATDQIIGAKGGNIVTRLNAQGLPYELLITDNIDLQMARNVWRWNIGGLGYSSHGYNGPFGLAITQNGAIVADFITAGTLTGNIIRAGTIRDLNNRNYWDLDTGDFRLAPTANVGDTTLANYVSGAVETGIASQTQLDIFNKLTNGGQTQGIYLQNGKLYINAEFLKAGVIADEAGRNAWNLNTGEMRVSARIYGGTIAIGGTESAPVFEVDEYGKVIMKNFSLDGVGNASAIGCDVFNCNTLRVAEQGIYEGDLDMNGGDINAGDINASTVSCSVVDCGTIYCQNPPWNSMYDDSDRRLKKDIKDIDGMSALAFVLALDPKRYTFRSDERDAMGFIAQDVQDVMRRLNVDYPLIREKDDGYLQLNYTNLFALLVAAIQELAKE